MSRVLTLSCFLILLLSCKEAPNPTEPAEKTTTEEKAFFDWEAAHVYFLLTDRFNNGDTTNDTIIKRTAPTGPMRGFQGGDFAGIIEKIDEGYFTDLGINAIWLTPIWEQIHGGVDEGTGFTYAFHGYWAKDWTAIEPSYGTMEEFKTLVQKAHDNNIRILLDVVLNHTGPVTDQDPQWPEEWVRTGPVCSYQNQETAVTCTLTNNLPDIRTDSKEEVSLPEVLVEKWRNEGRLDQEIAELDTFFAQSGLQRTPTNYIIKWITDYARETGVDGFRVDTVKHVEEEVWSTFIEQSKIAYNEWKLNHKEDKIHDDDFFILGELYGYEVSNGRAFDFGDTKVDYFDYGFDAMINFGMKRHANDDYETLFDRYNTYRDGLLKENSANPAGFMNYISSHDDGQPFDPSRERAMESATKLILTTGMTQVYYGDESARGLIIPDAVGDATLRSPMNWDHINTDVLEHWQKLGSFRQHHPAIGAGSHSTLNHSGEGTLAVRNYNKNGFKDTVVIGAGLEDGMIEIQVSQLFPEATQLRNAYTNQVLTVSDGMVSVTAVNGVVLLEKAS